jgi:putative Ca2+/H+ antiporter (TMEM165/GDT1 family)
VQLGIVAIVFALVFVAELPDKTMIATLIMGSRYRPLLVWIGATVAFAIHAGLAVAVGQLLQLLPHRWIEAVTAGLFAGGAAYLLFVPEKVQEEEGEKEADTTHRGAKTIGAAFLVIFVGEFGDLTQILTANLAAKYHAPVQVFVGAFEALASVAALGASAAGPCSASFLWPPSERSVACSWPDSPCTAWSGWHWAEG